MVLASVLRLAKSAIRTACVRACGIRQVPEAATPDERLVAMLELSDLRRARERRLTRRVEDLPVGIAEVGPDGTITHIDGGALRYAGQSRSAWIGADLRASPDYSRCLDAAERGDYAAIVTRIGGRTQVAVYAPRGNLDTGEHGGALLCWIVLPTDIGARLTDGD